MKNKYWISEFKTCRNQINRDVYETVCAFLNRHGGTLLLGVKDSGEVQGVDHDAIQQIKKDFVTAINNPQKLTPATYLSVEKIEVNDKTILYIYVPESSQVHKCNGRIYDRNEDGDFDITDHTVQVARLYQRKDASFSENKIYPWIQVADLRADLIEKCRNYVRIKAKSIYRRVRNYVGRHNVVCPGSINSSGLSCSPHRPDPAQSECGSL